LPVGPIWSRLAPSATGLPLGSTPYVMSPFSSGLNRSGSTAHVSSTPLSSALPPNRYCADTSNAIFWPISACPCLGVAVTRMRSGTNSSTCRSWLASGLSATVSATRQCPVSANAGNAWSSATTPAALVLSASFLTTLARGSNTLTSTGSG
jgi:hypothetical protein